MPGSRGARLNTGAFRMENTGFHTSISKSTWGQFKADNREAMSHRQAPVVGSRLIRFSTHALDHSFAG